jgi:hypothetical protein
MLTERPPLVGEVSANFLRIEGGHLVSVTGPYGRILGFRDRSCYYVFQVAPQLCSWGWVDPFQTHYFSENLVGREWNPDLRICSQELWPLEHLEHRGGLNLECTIISIIIILFFLCDILVHNSQCIFQRQRLSDIKLNFQSLCLAIDDVKLKRGYVEKRFQRLVGKWTPDTVIMREEWFLTDTNYREGICWNVFSIKMKKEREGSFSCASCSLRLNVFAVAASRVQLFVVVGNRTRSWRCVICCLAWSRWIGRVSSSDWNKLRQVALT